MIHYYTIINRVTGANYNTEKGVFKNDEDDYTYGTEPDLKLLIDSDKDKFKDCMIQITKSEK